MAAAGVQGKFLLTAGVSGDTTGFNDGSFGSVVGVSNIHGVDVLQLATAAGGFDRFLFTLEGASVPDTDASWIQFIISGVFAGGQAEYTITRASLEYAGGNPTLWRSTIGAHTDPMVNGNVYEVLLT